MAAARTVQLGQFLDENAELVSSALQAAGIEHREKRSTGLTRWLSAADWGTRLYVPEDELDRARAVARQVTGNDPV